MATIARSVKSSLTNLGLPDTAPDTTQSRGLSDSAQDRAGRSQKDLQIKQRVSAIQVLRIKLELRRKDVAAIPFIGVWSSEHRGLVMKR